jgi:FkbM family methyltransferase
MASGFAHRVERPEFELGNIDFESPLFRQWLAGERDRQADLRLLERPVVLLGSGSDLAQAFVDVMLGWGRVVALVDNARAGGERQGVPIIGDGELARVLQRVPDAAGILCCGSEAAIAHFRALWGAHPTPLAGYFQVIAQWPAGHSAGERLGFLPSFSDDDGIAAAHGAARRVLHDAESRRTLDALCLYRSTWDGAWLSPVARPEKAIYFEPDVMPLHDHEVFVDGGAFDGDTVRDFHRATSGRYDHIHSFEIDPGNFDAFRAKTRDIPNVTLHGVGLWSTPAELAFEHRTDNGSRVSAAGSRRAFMEPLDNREVGAPTLIKLDVEGAEVEALKGASRLIRRHKPKLAICAYHRSDDFVNLIDTVMSIRDDYRFALRHYSPIIYDSVLYCL